MTFESQLGGGEGVGPLRSPRARPRRRAGRDTKQLVEAGLLELFVDDEPMRLTPEGEKVARQLAMSDDQDELMKGLLE